MKQFLKNSRTGAAPHYRYTSILLLAVLLITSVVAPGQAQVQSAARSTLAVAAPSTVMQLVSSRALPNVLVARLASSEHPLRYSLDGGRTWRLIVTPWSESYQIAVAPRANGSVRILASALTDNRHLLYRTGDFGATWSEGQAFPGYWGGLIASPADPQRLYVSGDTGWYTLPGDGCFPFPCEAKDGYVYTSSDAGITWQRQITRSLAYFEAVVPSPVILTTAYVGDIARVQSMRWIELPSQKDLNFPIDRLALDPVDPAKLYGAVFDSTSWPTGTITIGKTSTNGGNDWLPWAETPPGCVHLMAHPTKSGYLYLRCAQGLYRSIDSGQHWQLLSPIKGDLLVPNYGSPGQLLWAREDGLWASNDDGNRWDQLIADWVLYQVYLPGIIR